MKFLHLHQFDKVEFGNIEGYDDIKDLVRRALDSDENYNLLLIGPPASSKTLFLMGILDIRKDAIYFDGSNTTNRILDVLEEKRPKIILLDELDKMGKSWQTQLLNFMESGRVDVEQQRKQYHFEIKGAKVFATCNEINRLSKPLQSRFRKIFLPRYTEEQFLDVSEKVLSKTSPCIARYIGATVWKSQGDIRDVISIGKLVRKSDGPREIEQIMNTMTKYGNMMQARGKEER
jgi:DNA polymerase III delta prime subunit